jgi:hypothetical protein
VSYLNGEKLDNVGSRFRDHRAPGVVPTRFLEFHGRCRRCLCAHVLFHGPRVSLSRCKKKKVGNISSPYYLIVQFFQSTLLYILLGGGIYYSYNPSCCRCCWPKYFVVWYPFFILLFSTYIQELYRVPPDHLLLDSSPNLGPLITRWEINKFTNR